MTEPLPSPGNESALVRAFRRHVAPTSPFPVGMEVARAEGCCLYDAAGRRHLDFISGIAVANVGHCHPEVVRAIADQARLYAHTMVYGEHVQRPQVEFAEHIAAVAPERLNAVYFMTTGAETNDAALKMAAKLTGRSRFVAFDKAYHGDTIGALSCFGDEEYRRPFQALLLDVDFLPFGDTGALGRIGTDIAGVIVEPVQGEAGIRVPHAGWLPALRARCDSVGAMLIFDEVQTGFGRVGEWFAAGHFGVTPDIITAAKGMGAGMPVAGLIAARGALEEFAAHPPFSHITTFGGHPVSCAAGLAGMRIIERDGLLARSRAVGERLRQMLRDVAHPDRVVEVRGVGLMIGVVHATGPMGRQVVERCRERGLIVETNLLDERVVRFSPPLTISDAECDEAVSTYSAVLEEIGS